MAEESFVRSEQIARDIKLGTFPAFSEDTKREMALAKAVFEIALESLAAGAPGLSDLIRRGIARSIAMKVSAHSSKEGGET